MPPGWLASTMQLPGVAGKETIPVEIEQSEVLDPSMVKATGKPEVAVAVGV